MATLCMGFTFAKTNGYPTFLQCLYEGGLEKCGLPPCSPPALGKDPQVIQQGHKQSSKNKTSIWCFGYPKNK